MTDDRVRIGSYGEDLATDYLAQRGYHILARNWRRRGGELDIIAATGPTLVFIEVRTRRTSSHALAAESVDRRKQRQVRRIASLYLSETDLHFHDLRFDAITITLSPHDHRLLALHHFQNAF